MIPPRELALSQARIHRARDNIKEFSEILDQYLTRCPGDLIVDIDEQGRGTIRVVRREPIPVQLPILLGEALQNLRAGLDNCLYAVAILDSGENPPPGATRLQWPITVTPKEWKDSKGRIQHLSLHLITALHRIQPFQAQNPDWNSLRILHDLARVDRHRAPHELVMWLRAVRGTFDPQIIHDPTVKEGPVSEDGVIATFTKTGPDELSPAMLDLEVELEIDVREVELVPHLKTGKPARPWGPLDNRLKAACKAVEQYTEEMVAITQDPSLFLDDEEYEQTLLRDS